MTHKQPLTHSNPPFSLSKSLTLIKSNSTEEIQFNWRNRTTKKPNPVNPLLPSKTISPSSPIHTSISIPHLLSPPPLRVSTKDAAVFEPPNDFVIDAGATEDEDPLPAGLIRELMPNHVAVVMDGNRRWARMRGLQAVSGYNAGVGALKGMVELCCKWGIKVLTVFAFSSENWVRPQVS